MCAPGPWLPWLTPTLVFPVILKRKLKVLRREEPAQVPEPRSSWLQLWGERGEGGDERVPERWQGRCHESGAERRRTRAEGREGCSHQAWDPQRKGEEDRKTPPPPTWSACLSVRARARVSQAPRFMSKPPGSSQTRADHPFLLNPGPISALGLLPTEATRTGGSLRGGAFSPRKTRALCGGPSPLSGLGLWASRQRGLNFLGFHQPHPMS